MGVTRLAAAEMAAKYIVPEIYADYREMISRAGLEAVVVASPDDLHHEMTLAALDAGLHVMCEKPLAQTVAQAQAMYERAQSSGLKNLVMFTNRWLPIYRYARDLIQQGLVGRLYHCEFHYQFGYARHTAYLWRYDQDRANGVLGDLGVHMFDMARWMVGEITSVSADLKVFVKRYGADGESSVLANPANDSAILLVNYASGAHGTIRVSSVNHQGNSMRINLYGESGTLEVGEEILAARSQDDELVRLEIPPEYFAGVDPAHPRDVFLQASAGPRYFIDAILNDLPSTPDFYDGLQAQRVIEAALEANRLGRRVEVK